MIPLRKGVYYTPAKLFLDVLTKGWHAGLKRRSKIVLVNPPYQEQEPSPAIAFEEAFVKKVQR